MSYSLYAVSTILRDKGIITLLRPKENPRLKLESITLQISLDPINDLYRIDLTRSNSKTENIGTVNTLNRALIKALAILEPYLSLKYTVKLEKPIYNNNTDRDDDTENIPDRFREIAAQIESDKGKE